MHDGGMSAGSCGEKDLPMFFVTAINPQSH